MAISANVYYLGERGAAVDRQVEAVEAGLHMVGDLVGGIVLSKALQVKLATESDGSVKPERVGFKNFEKFSDIALHVFAVPMSEFVENGRVLGKGSLGTGVSFVNTKLSSHNTITKTAAHETVHALGFDTLSGEDNIHCARSSCLMYPKTSILDSLLGITDGFTPAQKQLAELAGGLLGIGGMLFGQTEKMGCFCDNCTQNISLNFGKNLARMMLRRNAQGFGK